ncbi:2,3-diaminopropionate biosynthesis protein SbnB [Pseudoalteromonas piscicida]|uniref:2,3-diaminopropionate biosynthesis protein SbnB n=1 Tax=Pseudoalteromonas piscicida TaxID=43662 RepID=UPI0032C158C5
MEFCTISGEVIAKVLAAHQRQIVEQVKHTYISHHKRLTNNPNSYFLRFSDKPEARIIALPAAINDGVQTRSGIKWISSYPKNIEANIQRASAVVILNDYETGYPLACLEGAQISAARTSASAVLAASTLKNNDKQAKKVAFIGNGYIAKTILSYFHVEQWHIDEVCSYDLNQQDATQFAQLASAEYGYTSRCVSQLSAAIDNADIVVLATNAAVPYLTDPKAFHPGQIILNISLRDLGPEVVMAANNVLDDVEHCLKANTSPHLAEQQCGNRDFINTTLPELLAEGGKLDKDKPTIFSPFGLGVLDIALANFIYIKSKENGQAQSIDGFFPSLERW